MYKDGELPHFFNKLERFVDTHRPYLVDHKMEYQSYKDDGLSCLGSTFKETLVQYLIQFDESIANMYVSIKEDTYLPIIESDDNSGWDDQNCLFHDLWQDSMEKTIIFNDVVMIKILLLLVQNRYTLSYHRIYFILLADNPEIFRLLWHPIVNGEGDCGYSHQFEKSLMIGMSMNRHDIIELYKFSYDKQYINQSMSYYRYIMGQTEEIPGKDDLSWLREMRDSRIDRNMCNQKYLQIIFDKLTQFLPDDCIYEIIAYLKSGDILPCPDYVYKRIREIKCF